MMPGAPHHQGNLSLDAYASRWVRAYLAYFVTLHFRNVLTILLFHSQSASHGGQPCGQLKAYALAHKGKATANIDYNPEDPPSAYSNSTVHTRLSEYTSMAREVHGADFDPTSQDIDGEIVMRVGGGKKHGRYWIGDSTVDTASTPTLSQIRARSTGSAPPISQRPTVSQMQLAQVQVNSFFL